MRHNWSLIVVILFMLGAGAAERCSYLYVQRLKAKDKDLVQRAAELKSRTTEAPAERKKYEEIEHLADLVQDKIRWEPDSTRVMRSFGEIAGRLGVKLVETRAIPVSSDSTLVAGGAYQRMRIDVRLRGSFWGLLQYVDTIESSPTPMVVESLVLGADRDASGAGELRLTVSALYPAPPSAGSGATAEVKK